MMSRTLRTWVGRCTVLHLSRSQVSGIVVSPLSFLYCELKRTKRGTCRRVRELYINLYTSVVNLLQTDIHRYKHNLRLRPHKCPPRPHNYVPHAKAFGNQSGEIFHSSWLPAPLRNGYSELEVHTRYFAAKETMVRCFSFVHWAGVRAGSNDALSVRRR